MTVSIVCTTCNGYRWLDDRGSPCSGQPFFDATPCADCNLGGHRKLWGQEPGDPGYVVPIEPVPPPVSPEQLVLVLKAEAAKWRSLLQEVATAYHLTEMPLEGVPAFLTEIQRVTPKNETLVQKIASALNCHSMENGSNTPDFLLAEYLLDSLAAWNKCIVARAKWYGVPVKNGVLSEADGALVEPVELGTFCPECGLPQWRCPSGLTCDNGHGY